MSTTTWGSLRPHPSVSLDALEETAALQTRVDRKYVVPRPVADLLVASLDPEVAVLRIQDHETFAYESLYFDTPDLRSYRLAACGRSSRFKVRIRTYVDSGLCMLEVKCRDGRSATVKHRTEHALSQRTHLTDAALRFVSASAGIDAPEQLTPTITTLFDRTTLLDPSESSRTTIDCGLRWRSPDGDTFEMPSHGVIETKSLGSATTTDRWLWRHGHRPARMSKYCVGVALHDPTLPANRWNRLLRTTFGWTPDRTDIAPRPASSLAGPKALSAESRA